MTSLVKAIQERLAKICESVYGGPAHTYASENADTYRIQDAAIAKCAAAIRVADLSDLEPKEVEYEALAAQFHQAYERLAPVFGYETSEATRTWNPDSANGKLMIAVSIEVVVPCIAALTARLEAKEAECEALQHDIAAHIQMCVDLTNQYEALRRDAERYRWLLPYLIVAADGPNDWTCWLALECIPYRSKESDAQTLLDELMQRFPLDAAKDSHVQGK